MSSIASPVNIRSVYLVTSFPSKLAKEYSIQFSDFSLLGKRVKERRQNIKPFQKQPLLFYIVFSILQSHHTNRSVGYIL